MMSLFIRSSPIAWIKPRWRLSPRAMHINQAQQSSATQGMCRRRAVNLSMRGSQDSARLCGTVHGDGYPRHSPYSTGLGNFDREGLGQLVAGLRLEPGESSRNTLIETWRKTDAACLLLSKA